MPLIHRLSPIIVRVAGTAIVAALVLLPRTLQAEEVSDEERMGEYDEDGARFGDVVVKGELVASTAAPGGWTLLRTYENKGDTRAKVTVEERVTRTDADMLARVGPDPTAVLARTQVLELAPHEKRAIGTYLPAALADQIGVARRREAFVNARVEAGNVDMSTLGTVTRFEVAYLRPLARGEVAARRPNRAGGGGMGDIDDPFPLEIGATAPPLRPTVRTLRGARP